MWMIVSAAAMFFGFFAELTIGWPLKNWHPVSVIGKLISGLEETLRKTYPRTPQGERTAGIIMAATVPITAFIVPAIILAALYIIHPLLGGVVEFLMCWSIFATKSLRTAAMEVYNAVNSGDLEAGKQSVAMIVGRDTGGLTEAGIIKATVETVAENLSDGVIAPMLFILIGGAPLGYFYKGVNTMDSMVGYKNDKYMYFGTGAAKLDDACNFIPSRFSGILMILCSGILGLDIKNAAKIFRRDRKKHASPNSAQTESVMAGALDVQLAGDAYYFGKLYRKEKIGDSIRPITKDDIPKSCRLLWVTSTVSAVICFAVRLAVGFLLI